MSEFEFNFVYSFSISTVSTEFSVVSILRFFSVFFHSVYFNNEEFVIPRVSKYYGSSDFESVVVS